MPDLEDKKVTDSKPSRFASVSEANRKNLRIFPIKPRSTVYPIVS